MMYGETKARFSDALGQFGYLAAAVVIVVTGWAVYGAGIRMKVSAGSVDEALQVLVTLAQVNESLTRAEAEQRDFLLTGLERNLTERNQALNRTQGLIESLQTLVPAPQRPQARALHKLFDQRMAIMHAGETLRLGANGLAAAAQWRTVDASGILSDRIRDATGAMRAQALQTLDDTRRRQQKDYDQAILVLVLAVLVSMAVMIPGYAGYVLQSRARRKVEHRFEDLAELLPGAVYQFRHFPDGSGRYEFLSSGTATVRGVDREAALKDPEVILSTLEPAARRRLFELVAIGEATGSPVDFDFKVRDPDGSTRWLNGFSAPSRERDGSTLWSGHWSDITEKKAMQEALEESKDAADAASRAKSRFLATMSHEIRTPMNGVLGMLELLSLTKLDAEQHTTLEIVRESGQSLLRIIDDILDFSKVEAGKLELKPEPTSIRAILERVVNIYRGSASSKGLLFSHSYDDRIAASVLVDPGRLQQILNNLVSNAIKFTDAGEIELRAVLVDRREGADVIRFTVLDTGIGMGDADRALLFEPFTQIGSDAERRFAGTGLGLSICRRLVELMGGTIDALGQLGKGTRMVVTLTLPVVDVAVPPPSAATTSTVSIGEAMLSLAAREGKAARVLVVDDHPVSRLVVQKQVAALGYLAESAVDGEQALQMWRADRFDLIVTDCNMPGMNGYALAREVRKTEAREGRPRTPMIACTANALSGEAENCYAAGMDDYLAKPVELRRLGEKLRRWLADAPAERVMDESALEQIAVGPESRREVLADFRRYNDADAAVLESAIEAGDVPAVIHAAHRIKGAGRTVGALALAAVAERIERSSRAGNWIATVACVEAFRRELGRLNAHIDSGTSQSITPNHAGEPP